MQVPDSCSSPVALRSSHLKPCLDSRCHTTGAYLKRQGLPYYQGDAFLVIAAVTVALFVPVLAFGRDQLDDSGKEKAT